MIINDRYLSKGVFMGGQEGARGYFYQAFASTLEALNNPNWDNIYVEFKTDNDKVDIALELNKEIKKNHSS